MGCSARRCALLVAVVAAALGSHAPVVAQEQVSVPLRFTVLPTFRWSASQAFAERWSVRPDDVHVEWTGAEPAAPDADDRITILGDGSGGRFVVEITSADGMVRRSWVRAGVVTWVARARVDLPRGVTIDSAHVERVQDTAWGGPAYVHTNEIIGWVTRRPVAAGDLLEAPAVAPKPAVEAGQDVRVLLHSGPIRLALSGRALATAAAGDAVRVRLDTGKRMVGVAHAEGVVLIDSMETMQ